MSVASQTANRRHQATTDPEDSGAKLEAPFSLPPVISERARESRQREEKQEVVMSGNGSGDNDTRVDVDVDVHWAYWTTFKIKVFGVIPVCLVGMLVNMGALGFLIVRTRRGSTIRLLLMALTTLDTVQLAFSLPQPLGTSLCDLPTCSRSILCSVYRRFAFHAAEKAAATVDTAHIWLVVAITLHRYWKISHPFHSHIHDTPAKVYALLGLVLSSAILFRLPSYAEQTYTRLSDGQIVAEPTALEQSQLYHNLYYGLLNTILFNLLPFATLTCLNALIIAALCHVRAPFSLLYHQSTTRTRRRPHRGFCPLNNSLVPQQDASTKDKRGRHSSQTQPE